MNSFYWWAVSFAACITLIGLGEVIGQGTTVRECQDKGKITLYGHNYACSFEEIRP